MGGFEGLWSTQIGLFGGDFVCLARRRLRQGLGGIGDLRAGLRRCRHVRPQVRDALAGLRAARLAAAEQPLRVGSERRPLAHLQRALLRRGGPVLQQGARRAFPTGPITAPMPASSSPRGSSWRSMEPTRIRPNIAASRCLRRSPSAPTSGRPRAPNMTAATSAGASPTRPSTARTSASGTCRSTPLTARPAAISTRSATIRWSGRSSASPISPPGTRSFASITDQRTSARAALSLAFADGRLALARPILNGFAIIEPHSSAQGGTLVVNPTEDRPPRGFRTGSGRRSFPTSAPTASARSSSSRAACPSAMTSGPAPIASRRPIAPATGSSSAPITG